jgi:hypothetical protein
MALKGTVWVVLYEHAYGTDCWVRSSLEEADESIISTMRYYLNDVQNSKLRARISRALREKRFGKAIQLWGDELEEHFDIYPREIDRAVP